MGSLPAESSRSPLIIALPNWLVTFFFVLRRAELRAHQLGSHDHLQSRHAAFWYLPTQPMPHQEHFVLSENIGLSSTSIALWSWCGGALSLNQLGDPWNKHHHSLTCEKVKYPWRRQAWCFRTEECVPFGNDISQNYTSPREFHQPQMNTRYERNTGRMEPQ